MSNKCPKCPHSNRSDAKFCAKCGTGLNKPDIQVPAPEPPVQRPPTTPLKPRPPRQQPQPRQPPEPPPEPIQSHKMPQPPQWPPPETPEWAQAPEQTMPFEHPKQPKRPKAEPEPSQPAKGPNDTLIMDREEKARQARKRRQSSPKASSHSSGDEVKVKPLESVPPKAPVEPPGFSGNVKNLLNNRFLNIFLVLTLVVLVAGGSWWAASNTKSPAEIAAEAAPPAPSLLVAKVEQRVLTSTIVTRGTGRFGLPQTVSMVPSALKGEIGVITTLPTPNTQLNEGDVLLTASERPLFVLQGERPVFRDLVPGISNGNDVRQLEDALLRMGFDPGPIDGTFDEQTSTAIANWYNAAGWEPFGPTAEQQSNIRALEEELADVTNQKLAADEAVAAALLAVEAAQVSGDQVELQNAINEQNAAEREAQRTNNLVTRLTADLEQAQGQAGIQVPASEIVFIPALPVRVEEIAVAVGDEASGAVMTVTNNQLAIDSSLPVAEASLVKPGMPVAIDEQELSIKATGIVEGVADGPGTDGVDGFHVYFETRVEDTPTSLDGFSVRLTIPVESTGGAVIVVPLSALALAPDGTSRVQVKHNDDLLEFITVEPGLVADGFVQVTPLEGTLEPGQEVVIGVE